MKLAKEILKNLIKKPVTKKYPQEKPKIPENYRGKIMHIKEKCNYCGLCARNCPSHAITVDREKKTWVCDYSRCTFCGQCEEECNKIKRGAIKLTKQYEMAKKENDFHV